MRGPVLRVTTTQSAIQLRSPGSLLGRLLGLYQLSVISPIAIGSTVAGAMAEEAGIVATLTGCAALLGEIACLLPARSPPRPAESRPEVADEAAAATGAGSGAGRERPRRRRA